MADKIIAAKLTVDTGQANTNIKETNSNLKDVKQSIKDVNAASGSDIKQASGHFSKLKEQIQTMPGPLGQASQGVQGLSQTFKALLANPVVLVIAAIVAILAGLFKAFQSTRAGGEKLSQLFAFLGGAIDKVTQIMGDFVAEIKSVGDFFSKIGNILRNPIEEFKKLGKAIGDAANESARLKRVQQTLERDFINNLARNKELIKQEEALKNIRDNEFKSIPERIAANEKASAIEKERLKTLEQLQLREVARLQDKVKLAGGENKVTNEQLRELREAEMALEEIREESIGRENEFLTNRFQLNKEAVDKQKELQEAANAKRLEREKEFQEKRKQIEDEGNRAIAEAEKVLEKTLDRRGQFDLLIKQYEARKEAARKAGLDVLKITKAFQQERAELEKKFAEEDAAKQAEEDKKLLDKNNAAFKRISDQQALTMAQDKANAEARKQLAEQEAQVRIDKINTIAAATSALSDLIGRETLAGKILAGATALINTYQGASEAIKQKSTLPSPFDVIAKIANVTAIIATGLKTVKAIASVQIPGRGSGGGVSAPSITAAAPIAPTVGTTQLDQTSLNAIGNATSRAYVLDADVQNNRERNTRLNRAARLGG